MSNSGVPQFPQPGQYRADTTQRSAGNNREAIGRIEHASAEIRAEITARRQEIRAQGEVTQVNPDNSVRVSTPRGEVEIQLPADQPRPSVGQRVEIQITPPSQVVIRPSAEQVQPQTPTRPTATPVQIEVRGEQPQTAQTTPPRADITPPDPNAPPPVNRFPEAGSIVRIEPITPQQLQQLSDGRQLSTPQVIWQSVASVPVADIVVPQNVVVNTGDNAPITQSTASTVTPQATPLNSVQILDIPAEPQLTQASQISTSLASAPPALTNIAVGDDNISVPVLTRAQAAVVQLQNAAAGAQGATNPPPLAPQDVRVGTIQTTDVGFTQQQSLITGGNNAAQFTGTVIAHTQNQVPIVQFSLPQSAGQPFTINAPLSPVEQQTYILQFPSDALVLGSKIHVTPQTLNNAITTTQPNALVQALPFANITFPQSWPIMTEIQQTLTQITTQAAAQSAQAFTASIPSPANATQFGPAALLFVAAMRGGDMSSWLGGKGIDALRSAGKDSLLSRLGDLNTMTRAADAPSGEWRGMQIPLMWDGDIQKIALHYKREDDQSDSEAQSGNAGTRFVFDLNLDAMGKVQLDGFFRPVSSDGPRLDVVLRTEERFSISMQAEMRRIYMDAIKPSQVGGELSFRDGTDAWVMIDAEDPAKLGVSA